MNRKGDDDLSIKSNLQWDSEKLLRSESNPLHTKHFKTGLKSFQCTSTKHCTALKSSRIMNMSANICFCETSESLILDKNSDYARVTIRMPFGYIKNNIKVAPQTMRVFY